MAWGLGRVGGVLSLISYVFDVPPRRALGRRAVGTSIRSSGAVGGGGDFCPDRLARGRAQLRTPPVRQRCDQEHASARLRVVGGEFGFGGWVAVCSRIGHLHTERVRLGERQGQAEAPAGDVAVQSGVVRELRDDLLRGLERHAPCAELLACQQSRQAGASARGGQEDRELAYGGRGPEPDGFLIHVTQRGRACVP